VNLHVLAGPNFSGRTHRLRVSVGLPSNPGAGPVYSEGAYIGPDAASAFSGIASTVAAELDLMAADRVSAKRAMRALEDLGFGYCLGLNPFTLSGGEQVVAAVVVATASGPKRLAIDCALEQLSADARTRLLAYLTTLDGHLTIADNRLDEWFHGREGVEELQAQPDSPMIHPDSSVTSESRPSRVEVIDLSHSYVKGRSVLTGLNLIFSAGELCRLRGPNGSGKSTLSKIMCGLIKPSSGEIRVDGRVVKPWLSPGKYVSYHFQNPDYQLFTNSVRLQLSQSKDPTALARSFGLESHLDDHPLDLPFVLKKRVAIASALARSTGYLILDEPTLGQDRISVINQNRIIAYGLSGLVISHSEMFSGLREITLPGPPRG